MIGAREAAARQKAAEILGCLSIHLDPELSDAFERAIQAAGPINILIIKADILSDQNMGTRPEGPRRSMLVMFHAPLDPIDLPLVVAAGQKCNVNLSTRMRRFQRLHGRAGRLWCGQSGAQRAEFCLAVGAIQSGHTQRVVPRLSAQPHRGRNRSTNAQIWRRHCALTSISRDGRDRKTLPRTTGKGMVSDMFLLAENTPGSVRARPLTPTQAKRADT